ncbi:YbjN domain-containing protein [Actinomyces sp. B33]|uniref:YbjN domain-containing protein n=1 Tax=Actinomyces sp. B33 TaxID=2942131 RepID=UPI00233FBF71|nr:YbjN domain-containing protein [Actinomyces sp. B33]MDC4233057.1 YbjN domain-containing protein [Actinomyces sp. B33]
MPEWKTFSLDGDSSNPLPFDLSSATPATAPTAGREEAAGPAPDEPAAKWGTEVLPVTLERIEAVLAGDGLSHGRGEFVVVTQIEGQRFQVHREPADCPWMQLEARMDLDAAATTRLGPEELRRLANGWNADHLQPTVFALESDGESAFVLVTRFFVGEGLSDRQIHTMVRRGLVVSHQAMTSLRECVGA